MANTLITPSIIAREALRHLENHIVMGGLVHREYRKEYVKIGDTLTIRRPVQFNVSTGATRVNQDVTENTTSIVINQRKHVSWSFSTQDLTLTIEEYADRYLKPAMISLANDIDVSLLNEAVLGFHTVGGDAASSINTFPKIASGAQRLDERAAPDDGYRCAVLDPASRWALSSALGAQGATSIYAADIVGPMVRRGYLGDLAGLKTHGDQNVQALTVGDRTNAITGNGFGLTTGAAANGATSAAFDNASVATSSGYLLPGEVIQFDGVFEVNPISKQSTGKLAEFVATNTVTTATSAGTVNFLPALNDGSTAASAAYQNVTALPGNNTRIQVAPGVGSLGPAASTTVPMNVAFHRNSLALVTVPLELPNSANFRAQAEWNGFSIRVVKDYDITNDEEIIRLDTLYGVKAIYPELGVKMYGLAA